MKVVIDGKWELELTAPPRVGEIIASSAGAERVAEVVWLMPDDAADEVHVHIQLEGGAALPRATLDSSP
ncbi:hypothetical protein [Streptomyces sp. NBC_01565]|uniref:hypothetical protein n=1 Tax=Streptomyces sp. NBC_01565 TaxID=2975881 RepID=UPI0022571DA8|nr:hypothetical protein [Streptomyces sp. NBC_01565]MCX4543755.1 hypothetical protein [Streptomyces sp. NBC_01565]